MTCLESLKVVLWTDARQQQQLGCSDCSRRQNYFIVCANNFLFVFVLHDNADRFATLEYYLKRTT